MVIKNLENKIKLVGIICSAFLMGCIIISVSTKEIPALLHGKAGLVFYSSRR